MFKVMISLLSLLVLSTSALAEQPAKAAEKRNDFCQEFSGLKVPSHLEVASCHQPVIQYTATLDGWKSNAQGSGDKKLGCRSIGDRYRAFEQKRAEVLGFCNDSRYVGKGTDGAMLLRNAQAAEVAESARAHLAQCVLKLDDLAKNVDAEKMPSVKIPESYRQGGRITVRDILQRIEQQVGTRARAVSAGATPACNAQIAVLMKATPRLVGGYKNILSSYQKLAAVIHTDKTKFQLAISELPAASKKP